jgi:hypothetical protein
LIVPQNEETLDLGGLMVLRVFFSVFPMNLKMKGNDFMQAFVTFRVTLFSLKLLVYYKVDLMCNKIAITITFLYCV